MARMWMHTVVQAHSPISRQLGTTPSALVQSVLARRSFSTSASSSGSFCSTSSSNRQAPSSCSPGLQAFSSLAPQTGQIGQTEHFPLCAAGGSFSCQFRSASPSRMAGSSRISTVAGRAIAGSEVGVGSGAGNKDREILVQHILVKEDDVRLLIELQREIIQGGVDLSDLAEEHSICASKDEGGMLGWIRLGQTDPVFEEAAFKAPLNKLVRVKTQHGLHLLQVLGERKPQFLQQLQVEELHERMQHPTFLDESQLIDVREPDEIATAAIKGFEAYPLSQFGRWAPNIADDLDPEKDTYVLCHHGMRSMQAASWLQSQGFTKLYNVSGGIHAYSTKVDSSIPTY